MLPLRLPYPFAPQEAPPTPPPVPTLTLARAKDGSITTTGFIPQWTAS